MQQQDGSLDSLRRTRTSHLMESTGWLTIREQVRHSTAVLTWKLVNLRRSGRLVNRMIVTDFKEILVDDNRLQTNYNSFRWRAAKEWNLMTQDLREMTSLDRFKKHLKTLLRTQMTRAPD